MNLGHESITISADIIPASHEMQIIKLAVHGIYGICAYFCFCFVFLISLFTSVCCLLCSKQATKIFPYPGERFWASD